MLSSNNQPRMVLRTEETHNMTDVFCMDNLDSDDHDPLKEQSLPLETQENDFVVNLNEITIDPQREQALAKFSRHLKDVDSAKKAEYSEEVDRVIKEYMLAPCPPLGLLLLLLIPPVENTPQEKSSVYASSK